LASNQRCPRFCWRAFDVYDIVGLGQESSPTDRTVRVELVQCHNLLERLVSCCRTVGAVRTNEKRSPDVCVFRDRPTWFNALGERGSQVSETTNRGAQILQQLVSATEQAIVDLYEMDDDARAEACVRALEAFYLYSEDFAAEHARRWSDFALEITGRSVFMHDYHASAEVGSNAFAEAIERLDGVADFIERCDDRRED
jgi:hypothetical protein